MVEPGKKPARGQAVEARGQVEVAGEVGHHRLDAQLREVAAQALRLRAQEVPETSTGT